MTIKTYNRTNMQKTVLITGGNKGIGLALTKLFLEQDDKVIVVARDFKDFIYADKVECIPYDLTDVENIPSLIAQIGKIDNRYAHQQRWGNALLALQRIPTRKNRAYAKAQP